MASPEYWFPAKRYGWGWGLPRTWQGWLVLLAYLTLVVAGIPVLDGCEGSLAYLAYAALLTAGLVAVCWAKGEPPRWRWGSRDA